MAYDVRFNRDVLCTTGAYFADASQLTCLIEATEQDVEAARLRGDAAQLRAGRLYRWDDVAVGYEQMCLDLMAGQRAGYAPPPADLVDLRELEAQGTNPGDSDREAS